MKFIITMIFVITGVDLLPVTLNQITSVKNSTIRFSIENAGIEVSGTIETVETKILFDPRFLSQSLIEATADPATITTGISIRDKHLKRSDYFDVNKFPVMRIVSKTFRKEGKNKFAGEFNLTIKNITKPVTVNFIRKPEGRTTRYSGTFTINRLDFNLGDQSLILNDNVRVEVDVVTLD